MITKNRSIFTLLFGFIIALSLALSFVFASGVTTAKASETAGGEEFYIYGASVRAQSEETNGEAAIRFHVLMSNDFYSAHYMGTDDQDVTISVKFMAKDLLEDGETVLTTAKTDKVRTGAVDVSWWNSELREGYKEAVAYYYGISSAYFDKDIAIAAIATTDKGDTIVTEQVSGSLSYVAYQADELLGGTTYASYYNTKEYTVLWKNEGGATLETDEDVAYGTTPTYDGATPTKAATAQYTYTFAGWDKSVVPATKDAVYTATYNATVNKYTVLWKDENGDTIETDAEVPYGTVPTYDGETPTKDATAQYTYTFAWDKEIVAVTGDVVYTATFTPVLRSYTVSIAVGQAGYGTVNQASVEEVPYGTVITAATNTIDVNGTVITATAAAKTNEWTYSFDSWTNGTATVNGNVTVTANFSRVENLASFLELTLKDEYAVDKTVGGIHYDYEIGVSSNTFVEVWSSMDGGETKNHNFIKTDISGMDYTYTVTKADGTAAEQHTIKRYANDQRYVFFTYAADEYYTLQIRVMNSHGGVDYKFVKINVDQSGNQSAVWFNMFEVPETLYNAYIHAAGGHTAGLTYSVGLENSRYGHERVLTLSNISSDAKVLFGSVSASATWFDGGNPQYYTLNITYYINSNGNTLTDYEIYNLIPKTYGSSWDCAGYTYETDKWVTVTYVYNKTTDGERVPLTHNTWVAMTDGKGIVLSNVTSYEGIEVYVSDISFGKTLPEYTPAAYELYKDNFIELEIASDWASEAEGVDYEIEAAAGKRIVLYHTDTNGTNYASDIVKSVGVDSSIERVQYSIKNNNDASVGIANRQYSKKYYYFQTDASVEYYLLTIYCENNVGAYDEKVVKIVVNGDETCALQTSTMTYEGTTDQGYYALPAHTSGVTCGSETGAEYGFGTMIKFSAIGADAKALCGNNLINGKTYNTVKMWVYIDSADHELTTEQIQGLTPKFFGNGWTCVSGYPTETDKWVEGTFAHNTAVTHSIWFGNTDGKGFVLSNTTGYNDIVVYICDVSISTVTE